MTNPRPAPTPKHAMSATNSAVVASRTSVMNVMPTENSAPIPMVTVMTAGRIVRTSGMCNAVRTLPDRSGSGVLASTAAEVCSRSDRMPAMPT